MRSSFFSLMLFTLGAFSLCTHRSQAEVPIDGYLPLVGFGLTDEFDDNFNFFPFPSTSPGNFLGPNGQAHFDVALLDTGAGFSLVTSQAYDDFNLDGPYPGEPDGYSGTEIIPVGGATGQVDVLINDPFGLYVSGLQDRSSAGPALTLNNSALSGQTNVSTVTFPPESELPNVIGLPFASQYATRIRSDSPQIFQLKGKTVRTPAIDFLPLGSGGNGITRKAPLLLNPGAVFAQPPSYLPNILNFDIDKPQENPSIPTVTQGALFVNATVSSGASSLGNQELFFDTGASVTVLSEFNALLLGFDVTTDQPEFTIPIVGSGGTLENVPGFFVDNITLPALGGSITANNVPVLVLDVTNPADPGNVVPGIIGTNIFSGRNIVIDPNPSAGAGGESAGLYISDPVTTDFNWVSNSTSADWSSAGSWDQANAPDLLGVTELNNQSGADKEAVVSSADLAWSVSAQGSPGAEMNIRIGPTSSLTVFSGTRIEEHAAIYLEGGVLDTQYLEIRDGKLSGEGQIRTGSGPISGQVEVLNGQIEVGHDLGILAIDGRLSTGPGTLFDFQLGGLTPGTGHDQIQIDGPLALDGQLNLTLANGFRPTVGNVFSLITYDELGGVFSTTNLPGGFTWDVRYTANSVLLEVLSALLPGDANGDGEVDLADLNVLASNWGQSPATFATGDFNGDGTVGLADLNLLGKNWTVPVGIAIPEPSSVVTLMLGTLMLSTARSRA